ncbi:MAG: hypothetical protein GY846_21745 [Deltaproteobacteria bacterium]|nr:hypothetical protein [Deltaproteobacteria bacterium]
MKKLGTGFICLSFLFCASVCSAAYMIHLKDGRDITTHEYWEEGGQIKIKQYGGVVGIRKEDVASIEKIDDPKTIIVKSPPKPLEKEPPPKTEEETTFVTENGSQKQKEASKSRKGNEKKHPNEILNEFDDLRAKFKNIESMSREDITQFDKALDRLRNKMLKADIGGSYTDHLSAIQFMGDKAEAVLKKRGQ